jgi:hypothetical protein
MYGPGSVPLNNGCTVGSIDLSIDYETILLTSEEREWCGATGKLSLKRRASESSMAAMRRRTRTDPQCPHP